MIRNYKLPKIPVILSEPKASRRIRHCHGNGSLDAASHFYGMIATGNHFDLNLLRYARDDRRGGQWGAVMAGGRYSVALVNNE